MSYATVITGGDGRRSNYHAVAYRRGCTIHHDRLPVTFGDFDGARAAAQAIVGPDVTVVVLALGERVPA